MMKRKQDEDSRPFGNCYDPNQIPGASGFGPYMSSSPGSNTNSSEPMDLTAWDASPDSGMNSMQIHANLCNFGDPQTPQYEFHMNSAPPLILNNLMDDPGEGPSTSSGQVFSLNMGIQESREEQMPPLQPLESQASSSSMSSSIKQEVEEM